MSKNVVVLGTQWGDEGKGKIVDLLTDQASAVVRFQGGHNAGHTLKKESKHTLFSKIALLRRCQLRAVRSVESSSVIVPTTTFL